MRLFDNWLQKLIALSAFAIACIAFSFAPVNAENGNANEGQGCNDTTSCLKIVAANTYQTLQKVNDLPKYLNLAGTFILNLTSADDSTATADMQAGFTGLGNQMITTNNAMNDRNNLIKLTADSLNVPVTSFNSYNNNRPPILDTLPNVNDLSYATVLGQAPVARGVSIDPYNYLKNAAGFKLNHIQPAGNWQGKEKDVQRYAAYYNTIMAIQNFDAYALNQGILENGNNQFSNLQSSLISQATNSNWFTTVGSEELGKVFRQILLFQSQSYVLLTNLIQTEKKLLTAQAMTNTLLILSNQDYESQLVGKAQNLRQ